MFELQTQNFGAAEVLPREIVGRLNELAALKDGWDEGDALKISAEAIAAAAKVLGGLNKLRPFQSPSMVPTFDGFLQMEWHNASRSLEFEYAPAGWAVLGVDRVNTNEPLYYTDLVPLSATRNLERFYIWFSSGDPLWPSR